MSGNLDNEVADNEQEDDDEDTEDDFGNWSCIKVFLEGEKPSCLTLRWIIRAGEISSSKAGRKVDTKEGEKDVDHDDTLVNDVVDSQDLF